MRRHSTRLVTVMGIVAISLLLMSAAGQCTITGSIEFPSSDDVSGKVVDAYTTDGVGSADLTLTYISGAPEDEAPTAPFTGTTADNGTYTISSGVPYGKYNLKAEKDDWVFIDDTVEISEGSASLPTIIGVEYEDDFTVSIIAMWDDSFDNVEAHITYPGGFDGDGTDDDWNGKADAMDSPYDNSASISGDADSGIGLGFFASESDADSRAHLAAEASRLTSLATVGDIEGSTVDNAGKRAVEIPWTDKDGGGPETVAIRTVPVDWFSNLGSTAANYNITPDSNNLLPGGTSTYAWVGVMQYYVHGKSGDLMQEGKSAADGGADATIYVVQGNSVLGKYRLPEFTTIDAASVVRINLLAEYDSSENLFFSFMQLVPNLQILEDVGQNEDIVPAASQDSPEVINVRMDR